jgi:hypothetical protein
MANNLKCEKFVLSNNLKNFLEESDEFKIEEIQTYFPIMGTIMNFFNSDIVHRNYVLNSRFKLIEFSEKEGIEISCDKGTENYKSYKSYIYDSIEKKKIEKQIFMKQCPILDPNLSMMNQYPSMDHNMNLPYSNKYWNKYYRKINNTNNATYVDCFFTYLGSKLVENNLSPNFPLYYGSFCGIAKEFEHDISEEYEDYKRKPWFIHGKKPKHGREPLFSLRYIKDNQEYESESDYSTESSEKTNTDKDSNQEIETNDEGSIDNEIKYKNIEENYNNIIKEVKNSMEKQNFDLECLEIDENGNCINKGNQSFSDISESNDPIKEFDKIFSSDDFNGLELKEIREDIISNIPEVSDLESIDGSVKMDDDKEVYAVLKNFPIQIICMEKCEGTLEDILEKSVNHYREIKTTKSKEEFEEFIKKRDYEWQSYLLQICFALSVAQKHYDFTHNDLHSSNIMFVSTKQEFIYYKFENKYYAIPTFGKILKIIDFGRAIYKIRGKEYFSDVFENHADAGGQYTYPYNRKNKKNIVYPNKSFDLSRLSTSIILDLYPTPPNNKKNAKYLSNTQKETESDLFNLLYSWIVDKYNKEVTRFEDFDLYKIIARRMTNAVPEKQINKNIFDKFIVDKNSVNIKKGNVYNY